MPPNGRAAARPTLKPGVGLPPAHVKLPGPLTSYALRAAVVPIRHERGPAPRAAHGSTKEGGAWGKRSFPRGFQNPKVLFNFSTGVNFLGFGFSGHNPYPTPASSTTPTAITTARKRPDARHLETNVAHIGRRRSRP